MDAPLFFEVLLYLNCYYFGLFFVSETIMVLAKYFSNKFPTPNINLDGGILCIIMLAEFTKLLTFRKIRESRPGRHVYNFMQFLIFHWTNSRAIEFFGNISNYYFTSGSIVCFNTSASRIENGVYSVRDYVCPNGHHCSLWISTISTLLSKKGLCIIFIFLYNWFCISIIFVFELNELFLKIYENCVWTKFCWIF